MLRSVTERALLPGEYVVLALLALRPMHGYEMARYVESVRLNDVCPIEQSQLYTYIRNVEERGLVSWTQERVGLRPPRKIYELNERGRADVDAWLRQPVLRMREARLDLLLKLYFLHLLDPAAERALLRNQLVACEAYLRDIRERVEGATGFDVLVARSKLSAAEATLRWLGEYAWELERQGDTLP